MDPYFNSPWKSMTIRMGLVLFFCFFLGFVTPSYGSEDKCPSFVFTLKTSDQKKYEEILNLRNEIRLLKIEDRESSSQLAALLKFLRAHCLEEELNSICEDQTAVESKLRAYIGDSDSLLTSLAAIDLILDKAAEAGKTMQQMLKANEEKFGLSFEDFLKLEKDERARWIKNKFVRDEDRAHFEDLFSWYLELALENAKIWEELLSELMEFDRSYIALFDTLQKVLAPFLDSDSRKVITVLQYKPERIWLSLYLGRIVSSYFSNPYLSISDLRREMKKHKERIETVRIFLIKEKDGFKDIELFLDQDAAQSAEDILNHPEMREWLGLSSPQP